MNSLTGRYLTLYQKLSTRLPVSHLITDPFQTQVYGTDASFYRLQPKLIVIVDNIEEVQTVLTHCSELSLPLCFRAAGTSLSGQAITDSVLVKLSDNWQGFRVLDEGKRIEMQCGVLGSAANKALKAFNQKLGPMPASIDAATAGGMAINNAAGMNSLDSYGQMQSAKFVFANGTQLDTADTASRQQFSQHNGSLINGIAKLRDEVLASPELVASINTKYQIKNTTGYSLRAFVDFYEPIDIISHLMIGSEGTLGFIESITHHTVPLFEHQATALVLFNNLSEAGKAIQKFKAAQPALEHGAANSQNKQHSIVYANPYAEPLLSAAELIDANALKAIADQPGMPSSLQSISSHQVALLIQLEASTEAELQEKIEHVEGVLLPLGTAETVQFSKDSQQIEHYWQMRKAIFPAVGANRPANTTALIEDVAFPIAQLPEALNDLQQLLHDYGYDDSVIYGHALDGNLHFIFSQNFSDEDERQRYREMMLAVTELVVDKYNGSLKAEHGTGRNMAPFVEKEWGSRLYQVMQQIKALFDPQGLLNPDVMLTADPELFVKNIKPIFASNELIDKCIECGFCERQCPSKTITFTPRQRIVGYREIQHQIQCEINPKAAQDSFSYLADQTCAGCGLCETSCPVDINVGELIREHRSEQRSPWQRQLANVVQDNFSTLMKSLRAGLPIARLAQPFIPTSINKAPKIPKAHSPATFYQALNSQASVGLTQKVVVFPSCVSRGFDYDDQEMQAFEALVKVLNRAGFEVLVPDSLDSLCCGLPFSSKGYPEQAAQSQSQLLEQLLLTSDNGRWPIFTDTSQCAAQVLDSAGLQVMDPLSFIADEVLSKLTISPTKEPIAFHLTCSARKNGQAMAADTILSACAPNAIQPKTVTCCGFAGDKGFSNPELNQAALKGLASEVQGCAKGYSTSRTCEIGLSHHSGIEYKSIFYLLAECSDGVDNNTMISDSSEPKESVCVDD